MTTINDTTMQGNISRRSFVKGASALAAGGALAGAFGFDIAHAEGTVDPDAPVEKRYTYCDMCNHVPKCGIAASVKVPAGPRNAMVVLMQATLAH